MPTGGSESESHTDRTRSKREALPTGVVPSQERFRMGGRYWIRTSDLFRVSDLGTHVDAAAAAREVCQSSETSQARESFDKSGCAGVVD
jgi:adenine-specific DNA methylase